MADDFCFDDENENLKNRAVIYARYSPGPNQRDESIEGQIRECREVARRAGLVVVETYTDKKISGTTDARPAFQKMLKDSERGLFDIVITWKIDRFARNRYDSAIYKQKLKKNNIRIMYAREFIPDGPEGIILESVLEGMAEWYSKNLAQNIRRGIRENALKCRAVGGRVPLGYVLGPDKEFLIDEKTAPVVLEIFSRYAAGERSVDICADLNNRGIRTSTGGKFNRSSLHRIFAQKKYRGIFEYADICVPDGVPRLVPDDLWLAVNQKVKFNARYSNHVPPANSEAPDFILTGRVFCGHCGDSMCGTSGRGRHGGRFYYYTCYGRRNKKTNCKKSNIKKELLEAKIADVILKKLLGDPAVVSSIIDACLEIQAREASVDLAAGLKAELADVQTSLKNIYTAIEKGIYSEGLARRLSDLESRAHELEGGIVQAELEKPNITREQLEFLFYRFKSRPRDFALVRELLDAFVAKVVVYDDRAVIYFNIADGRSESVHLADAETLFAPAEFLGGGSPADALSPLYAMNANPAGGLDFAAFPGGFAICVNL